MRRPARRRSQRGLLLVEAVLSAVVIAAGLVFVTRGLGGQLRALEAVSSYEVLSALAHDQLGELEARVLASTPVPPLPAEGSFAAPYAVYRWSVRTAAREPDETTQELLDDVILTVWDSADTGRSVTLSAVWPVERVPEGW